ALVNWYFMSISTVVVTLLGWWVTVKVVEPKLGAYDASQADTDVPSVSLEPLSPDERRALRNAGLSVAGVLALIAVLTVPSAGPLRLPGVEDTLASLRPVLSGVVVLVALVFAVPGIVYGWTLGTFKSDRDVIDAMSKSMGTMGLYIVLVFFAAQF